MATIVFLHAHPDDEASSTGGSIARAAAEGNRVVVVYGTDGQFGEVPDDLAEGETLVQRRQKEAQASADVLGTARVAWLGYHDSGMTGWDGNDAQNSFHSADLDEAAGRLAAILDEEDADIVTCYDWHGNYGHPDHVKVHPVAHRAAALAKRRPRVLEATMNRDALRGMFAGMKAQGVEMAMDADAPADDGNPFGMPEKELHWSVDVSGYAEKKKRALQSHASQVTDVGNLTSMPDEMFRAMFGREYYREHGLPNGLRDAWPF